MTKVVQVVRRGPKGDKGDPGVMSVLGLSSAHTAVLLERGYLYDCSAALTLSLAPASSLGNGWYCYVLARGGDVTIDPDGAETIDGAATKVVPQSNGAMVICDGTNFVTMAEVTPYTVSSYMQTVLDDTTAAEARGTLGVSGQVTTKSAAYTAVAADRGKVIRCTATLTLSLTAAATLGDGWAAEVLADGGAVTIDPDGAETINGMATIVVPWGMSASVWCDGSSFYAMLASGPPAGTCAYFASPTPPPGWLVRDGSAVSRTTYARLFAVIGTTFGAGDGSTTFNLPQSLGEFDRGWDNGRGIDPGRAFGSWQDHALDTHDHKLRAASGGSLNNGNWYFLTSYNNSSYQPDQYTGTGGEPGYGSGAEIIGTNTASETRPRNVALLPIIKY